MKFGQSSVQANRPNLGEIQQSAWAEKWKWKSLHVNAMLTAKEVIA